MPQPENKPRLITDGSTFKDRHPEAPDLVYPETLEIVPGQTPQTDDEVGTEIDSAIAEGRPAQIFGFVPDDQVSGAEESDKSANDVDLQKTAVADPGPEQDPAVDLRELVEAKATAEKATAALQEAQLARTEAEGQVRRAAGTITSLQTNLLRTDRKLTLVTTGDGLPRSPLLDNPDLDTTDPSAFRGSIIAIATLILTLLAAYGFGIRDDAREPILALLGTAATIYATYSIRKRAYSPVTTAKLVDTAYKAGLQGEDRPNVA